VGELADEIFPLLGRFDHAPLEAGDQAIVKDLHHLGIRGDGSADRGELVVETIADELVVAVLLGQAFPLPGLFAGPVRTQQNFVEGGSQGVAGVVDRFGGDSFMACLIAKLVEEAVDSEPQISEAVQIPIAPQDKQQGKQ